MILWSWAFMSQGSSYYTIHMSLIEVNEEYEWVYTSGNQISIMINRSRYVTKSSR